MLAKDVMSKKPEFLPPSATIKEAAAQMASGDYGFIPIGENDRLIGAITDRDITIRAIAKGKKLTTPIKEVMTKEIHYCFENDDLEKVVDLMEDLEMRRLVVLNSDKRMTGIISLGDVATKGKNTELSGELVQAVSEH